MGQVCDRQSSSEQYHETEMNTVPEIAFGDETTGDAMQSIKDGDFTKFLEYLPCDMNRRYEQYKNKTLLEHACELDMDGKFVEALLDRKADPNVRNKLLECSALHIAASFCNERALVHLLLHSDTDPNVLDIQGDNILHTLCRQKKEEKEGREKLKNCVETVLRKCAEYQGETSNNSAKVQRLPFSVNHLNRNGQTPVFLAAENKNEDIVRILLKHKCKIDIDDTIERKTTRDLLNEWWDTKTELPEKEEFSRNLFFHLYFEQEDDFVSRLKQIEVGSVNLNNHDGRHTLLQIAVTKRLGKAVAALLGAGADVNKTYNGELNPCQKAAFYGFPEILKLLVDKEADTVAGTVQGLSPMHLTIKGAGKETILTPDYKKCFEILLKTSELKDVVNIVDKNWNTPLHYAVNYGISNFVVRLMENGAFLGVRDHSGNTPLAFMNSVDLLKFLNSRIEIEDPFKPSKKLIFDIGFLKNFDNSRRFFPYSSQTLIAISREQQLRSVLVHPVFKCFLDIKWKAIRSLYWFFMVLYFLFINLLVTHFLYDEYHAQKNKSSTENVSKNEKHYYKYAVQGLILLAHAFLWFVFLIIAIINIFQCCLTWKSQWRSIRFFLKICLIISCFAFLVLHFFSFENWRKIISIFALLLSCSEFILLMGNIPKYSTYVMLLQTVSANFLKFFIWFSPLIWAFAMSFMSLFRVRSDESFLENLHFWAFKTFIMITGEYEASDLINSTTTPIVSYVVFIMFVFFIAIVLFNLLNALAICDSTGIIQEADLLATISQIQLMRHFELALTCLYKLCPASPCSNSTISRVLKKFKTALSLHDFVRDGKILVEVNRGNKLITNSNSKKSFRVHQSVTKLAEHVKKQERDDISVILRDLLQSQIKLTDVKPY